MGDYVKAGFIRCGGCGAVRSDPSVELKEKLAAAEESDGILKSEIERLQQLINYGKSEEIDVERLRIGSRISDAKKIDALAGLVESYWKDREKWKLYYRDQNNSDEILEDLWSKSETKSKLDEILEGELTA